MVNSWLVAAGAVAVVAALSVDASAPGEGRVAQGAIGGQAEPPAATEAFGRGVTGSVGLGSMPSIPESQSTFGNGGIFDATGSPTFQNGGIFGSGSGSIGGWSLGESSLGSGGGGW